MNSLAIKAKDGFVFPSLSSDSNEERASKDHDRHLHFGALCEDTSSFSQVVAGYTIPYLDYHSWYEEL